MRQKITVFTIQYTYMQAQITNSSNIKTCTETLNMIPF